MYIFDTEIQEESDVTLGYVVIIEIPDFSEVHRAYEWDSCAEAWMSEVGSTSICKLLSITSFAYVGPFTSVPSNTNQ